MARKICEQTMDFLDEFPAEPYPDWVSDHLARCASCRGYARISADLRHLPWKNQTMPQILSLPAHAAPRRAFSWRLVAGIAALVVAAVGVWIGLQVHSPRTITLSASSTEITSTGDTEMIDDYTTVALLW